MDNYSTHNKMKLGFGLMRLPKLEDETIDVEQTAQMVDLFLEAGGTYFDTAFAYPGSEEAIRKALIDRYPRSFTAIICAASRIFSSEHLHIAHCLLYLFNTCSLNL